MNIRVVKPCGGVIVITRNPIMNTCGQMTVSYQRKWHIVTNGVITL
ncbi:hypothetical protein [Vibrio phage vB_VpP_BA6]|nr:hypothetical protein [Vibrio phage vB_VpP_BA6]